MSYLSKAILHLKPTAEFSFTDNDYSTVKWDKITGNAPTQPEIDAAIEIVKTQENNAKAAAAAAKESAQAKLTALGLTIEDLKALGL